MHLSLTAMVLTAALSVPFAGPAGADLRHHQHGHPEAAKVVPTGWRLQPHDPSWKGSRFVSPDGSAWFAAYVSPVEAEPVSAHMDTVQVQKGEAVTYSRREHDWLAVSGFKGDRIFYRKAVLACGGTMWHHIAFEYPSTRKQEMNAFVVRASQSIDHAEYDSCAETPRAQAR
jgi:serine/threonine-protein kinase